MTDKTKDPKIAQPAARPPTLRIVASKDDGKRADDQETSRGKRNPLVTFMTAYADALDEEIKAILSL